MARLRVGTIAALHAMGCLLMDASLAQATKAQAVPDKRFFFYHGIRGTSGFIEPAPGGAYTLLTDRKQSMVLAAGSVVCVDIVNAHPLNYNYSLVVSVDSSAPSLPDLTKQAKLLQALIPDPGKAGGPALAKDKGGQDAAKSGIDAINQFKEVVRAVESELVSARKVVAASDTPEELAELPHYREARKGFRFAKEELAGMPSDKGHFNDPDLKATLKAAADAALKVVGDDELQKLTVTALAAYADALRSERDQLAGAFARTEPVAEACASIGKGRSTVSLSIAKKDSAAKLIRPVLKELTYELFNVAPYDRPLVSVVPVALIGAAPSAPEFYIDNGVLRDAHTTAHYRLGAVIALNRYGGGPLNLFGTSFGLGIGSGGSDDPISDVFGTVMLSVGDVIGLKTDVLRIGFGAGASHQSSYVDGFQVGDALPASAGQLEKRIQKGWKPAIYLSFVIPSLNVGAAP